MELLKIAILVYSFLFINVTGLFGDKGTSITDNVKHSQRNARNRLKAQPNHRRKSHYPDDSIEDILSKQGISHPASGIILPIFEKLLSGVNIDNFYEPQKSVGKGKEDKIAVIRSVSSSAIKLERGTKAKAYFNVSGSLTTNVKYSLKLNTKLLCKTTTFQRMKVKFLVRNEKWEAILKKSVSFTYRNICKKYFAMDIANLLDASLSEDSIDLRPTNAEITINFRNIEKKRETDRIQIASVVSYVAHSIALLVFSTEESPLAQESKKQKPTVTTKDQEFSHNSRTILNGKELFKFDFDQADSKISRNHRSKRNTKSSKKETKPECQRKDFIVDFETMGWAQWIVFPKAFNSYYCHGRCPSPVNHDFNPTNHALLQSIMRIYDRSIPRPCCSPTKLSALSMLYYENGELVVRHHENMIADSCGCR